MSTSPTNQTPNETAFSEQINLHQQAEETGSWAGFYKDLKQMADLKPKSDLTYRERHAVRHLRHQRDQEYNKLAFKLCSEFADTYSVCTSANPFSSPWACRRPLQELKACVNRQLLNFRSQEGEINTLPAQPMEHVDYEKILDDYYTSSQQPQAK
jgi:hypothetical protein